MTLGTWNWFYLRCAHFDGLIDSLEQWEAVCTILERHQQNLRLFMRMTCLCVEEHLVHGDTYDRSPFRVPIFSAYAWEPLVDPHITLQEFFNAEEMPMNHGDLREPPAVAVPRDRMPRERRG